MVSVRNGRRRTGGHGLEGPRRGQRACDTDSTVPFPEFLIAVLIAAGVSVATFRHADRNGSVHATAWGVGAFLAAGVVVPLYVIRLWLRKRRPPAGQ